MLASVGSAPPAPAVAGEGPGAPPCWYRSNSSSDIVRPQPRPRRIHRGWLRFVASPELTHFPHHPALREHHAARQPQPDNTGGHGFPGALWLGLWDWLNNGLRRRCGFGLRHRFRHRVGLGHGSVALRLPRTLSAIRPTQHRSTVRSVAVEILPPLLPCASVERLSVAGVRHRDLHRVVASRDSHGSPAGLHALRAAPRRVPWHG